MKNYFLVVSLLSLAACTTAGVKVDQSQLSHFHKGRTTYDDVVTQLGAPTQTMIKDDGTKTIFYSYVSAQPRPESFIPYVGPFVGGADTENSTVILNFDRRDILQSYNSTSGALGVGQGFEAISQPRNSSQPRKE